MSCIQNSFPRALTAYYSPRTNADIQHHLATGQHLFTYFDVPSTRLPVCLSSKPGLTINRSYVLHQFNEESLLHLSTRWNTRNTNVGVQTWPGMVEIDTDSIPERSNAVTCNMQYHGRPLGSFMLCCRLGCVSIPLWPQNTDAWVSTLLCVRRRTLHVDRVSDPRLCIRPCSYTVNAYRHTRDAKCVIVN